MRKYKKILEWFLTRMNAIQQYEKAREENPNIPIGGVEYITEAEMLEALDAVVRISLFNYEMIMGKVKLPPKFPKLKNL